MLERSATCLESGGRQLCQARNRALRSRRMLHSSFWHHGASDLNLPIWWACSFPPEPEVGDVDGLARSEQGATRTQNQTGLLLDFLYPEKTLALLQCLSSIGREAAGFRSKTHTQPSSLRRFSTSRIRAQRNDTEHSKSTTDLEVGGRLLRLTPIDALRELMATNPKGNEEVAWGLYKIIPGVQRSPALQADFLDYLGPPTRSVHATPTIRVFDSLPIEARRSSTYRVAISAHLMLDMVGPAVRSHEQAASHGISGDFGTSLLLGRTAKDDRWDLAIRVYQAYCKSSREMSKGPASHSPYDVQAHVLRWEHLSRVSGLRKRWSNFLGHIRQFRHELRLADSQGESLRDFAKGLFRATCKQVLANQDPHDDTVLRFFQDTFNEVRDLKFHLGMFYKTALFEINAIPRYREYSAGPHVLIEVYREWRTSAIENQRAVGKPGKRLLQALIAFYSRHGDAEGVDGILGDWRRFYPNEPIQRDTIFWLMKFHAEHGRANQVEQLFADYCSDPSKEADLRALSILVFVHARRVDVAAATQQFRRISEEFGLTPDRKCWNLLLLAYTRADDLDGALGCFNEFLQTGIAPDKFTFGPLLDLCAGRGDIEAFETLYSKAEQLKIPIGREAVIRTGYVEVFLNASDPEGAYAIAHRMLQEHRAGTLRGSLSVPWNMLIAFHALKGDVRTSRQLYHEMIENDIPVTSWTYGSLMRALSAIGQTNAAFKILRVTMPANNIRVHAFHYAIVMTGFLRERQFELAIRAYDHMVEHNVSQTPDSRIKALEVLGRKDLRDLEEKEGVSQVSHMKNVEDAMREVLLGDPISEIAHREPRHNAFIDSRRDSALERYFGLLISLYSSQGAYDVCKQMFETATSIGSTDPDYEPPIILLTALMEAHLQAGEHAEVDKCWKLVRSQAASLVKTFGQINSPDNSLFGSESILDPAIREAHANSRISPNRRHILVKPARIYIHSLLQRPEANGLQHAQRAICLLTMQGFNLDVFTWNVFIQSLCLHGRTLDAFTACEVYLMPQFPGWRNIHPNFLRKDRPGYTFTRLRYWDVTPDALLPKYKTLAILAGAYARIRKNEDEGRGYDPELGGWCREVLLRLTPLTLKAMETLPRVADGVQREYIENM